MLNIGMCICFKMSDLKNPGKMTLSEGKGNKQPDTESVYTDVSPPHFIEAYWELGKDR